MAGASSPAGVPPPPSLLPQPRRRQTLWMIVAAVLAGVVVLGGLVIFVFGEDLFGSDDGTIDSYNREVLDSCDVPGDSTLVRTYVLPDVDSAGDRVRTMSYVWASPRTGVEVAAFYGIDGPGIWTLASAARSCKFGQRPSVLVLDLWLPDQAEPLDRPTQTAGPSTDANDDFWAGPGSEVTDVAPPPGDTRSFVRLRLVQYVVEGVFGLGADDTAPAQAPS